MMLTRENKGFGALQAISFSGFAIVLGFNVIYFQHVGFSPISIASILTITNILNIFAQPFLGYVSDYMLPIRKVIIITTLISLISMIALPLARNHFLPVLLIYQIISFTRNTLPSVVDSYSAKIASKRSGLNYGLTRSIGSLGYAVTALALGLLIDRLGFDVMFVTHTLVCVLQIMVLLKLEEYPVVSRTKGTGIEGESEVGFLESSKLLLKNRKFVVITLLALVMFIGVNGTSSYVAFLVLNIGGTNKDLGMILFLSACIEVPVLWNYSRISRRIDDKYILLASFIGYFVKNFALTMANNVPALMLMQITNLFAYGAFLPSYLRYIQRQIPAELLATGIVLSTSVYSGLGSVIGVFAGGIILENYGVLVLYRTGGVFCLVGGLLFALEIAMDKKIERGF